MIFRRIAFVVLSVVWLSACSGVSQPDGNFHYATAAHIEIIDMIAPPPMAGSSEDLADLAAVQTAQQYRTIAQIQSARADAELSVFRFADVLGPKFSAQNLPATAALFVALNHDLRPAIAAMKSHFARPRPYEIDSAIEPVVPKPGNDSYPSGHAAMAYADAIILARLVPARKSDIMARARQYAQNRVIGGVHYPSDVEAGRVAAILYVKALWGDAEFQCDFAAAKNEIHLKLPNPQRR